MLHFETFKSIFAHIIIRFQPFLRYHANNDIFKKAERSHLL